FQAEDGIRYPLVTGVQTCALPISHHLRQRMQLGVPFASYYEDTELHALTEVMRKSLMAFPLGVLLRLSWPEARRQSMARVRADRSEERRVGQECGVRVRGER